MKVFRSVMAVFMSFLCFSSVFVSCVVAEYRKVEKTDIISLEQYGSYDRLENIANASHNTSYNSQSWVEFFNISDNSTYVGFEPIVAGVSASAVFGGEGLTIINRNNTINLTGVLDRFEFYLIDSGFLKLKIFRENTTHLRFIAESRVIYGFEGYNSVDCQISVRVGDLVGVTLMASNNGTYEIPRITMASEVGLSYYYNETNDIGEDWNISDVEIGANGYARLRVHIDGKDYNRTEYGNFIGSLIPESPFTFYNNLTGSADRLVFGNVLKFNSQTIMSGASEFWVRTPLALNSGNAYYSIRMKIYELRSIGFLNLTNVQTDDFSIKNVSSPKLIFDQYYYISQSLKHERNTFISSDNRSFLHAYVPIYPDQYYFIGFVVKHFDSSNITLYYSQCDICDDSIYSSFVAIGDYRKNFFADLGLSFLIVNGLGKNVRGYKVDIRTDEYLRIQFYSYPNQTVNDGDYLTFTYPFETVEGDGLDIRYRLFGVYDDLSLSGELINNTVLNCHKFYMNSTNISTSGESFNVFFIELTIYNPSEYHNESGTIPIFRFYIHDSNDLFFDSFNSTGKHHFTIASNQSSIEEYIFFSYYHSLQVTNGSWGLYERPTKVMHIYYIAEETKQYYNAWDLILTSLSVVMYIMPVFYSLTIVGESIWRFLELIADGMIYIYNRVAEALKEAGEWLWDNIGVYVYQAVTWLANAFVDAMVIFIQIMLFLVPIAVFIGFVTFWYKILRGFRIWYKNGYTAFALYMETEMIRFFTIIHGGWNLLRMKPERRREYLTQQVKKRVMAATDRERRIFQAEQKRTRERYGLPIQKHHYSLRSTKTRKGKAGSVKTEKAEVEKAEGEKFPGWRVKEQSGPSYSAKDRYNDHFGFSRSGRSYRITERRNREEVIGSNDGSEFPGWKRKQKDTKNVV